MLKEIREIYSKEKQNKEIIVRSPEDSRDYILSKYKKHDDINVVMFLDTKNQIIASEILPSNSNSKEEAKHIFKKAISYDSNSIMLITKADNKVFDNRSRVSPIDNYSEKVGIKLLDNIDISNNKAKSYRRTGIISEHILNRVESKVDKAHEKIENVERKTLKEILNEVGKDNGKQKSQVREIENER